MIDVTAAFGYTCVMGAVILLCRSLPFFLNFKSGLLAFVEKTAPPVAMAVLAVNALALPVKQSVTSFEADSAFPALAAAALCAILHVIKRNALISIFAATALYMALMVNTGQASVLPQIKM